MGEVSGSEVIQVYVGSTGAKNGEDRPVKVLKGMKRVETAPGEEKTVEIEIPANELRFYDQGEWILDPEYTIYVGTDSHLASKEARTVRLYN